MPKLTMRWLRADVLDLDALTLMVLQHMVRSSSSAVCRDDALEIAKATGMSVFSVYKAIRILRDDKIVVVGVRRHGEAKYEINIAPLLDKAVAVKAVTKDEALDIYTDFTLPRVAVPARPPKELPRGR